MQKTIKDMWDRVQAFRLSDPSSEVSFESQLADENGWTRGYAELVTTEYRRFLVLTQVSGQMVCPSHDVDQAWHLHLTQTVSYQAMCRELFGKFLHHHASKGGPDELKKHQNMYLATLESYRNFFDSEPNPAIWPDVNARFMTQRNQVQHVVKALKRPFILRMGVGLLPLVLVVGFIVHELIGDIVWSGVGPYEFLLFYTLALIASCVAPPALRSTPPLSYKNRALDPYEVAFLAGGAARVMGTAITRLLEVGLFKLKPHYEGSNIVASTCHLKEEVNACELDALHPFERKVLLNASVDKVDVNRLAGLSEHMGKDVHERLVGAGLAIHVDEIMAEREVALWLILGLGIVGVSRLIFGIEHDHPVLYLVALLAISCLAFSYHSMKSGCLTPLGQRAIDELKDKLASLKKGGPAIDGLVQQNYPNHSLIALGFALFGTQALMSMNEYAGINFIFGEGSSNVTGNSQSVAGCGGGGCGGGGCGGGCGG